MAITLVTQDLDNYPGTTKNVTVDVSSTVPTGYEGDEQIVLTISTTAFSDNTNSTNIQDIYVKDFKGGWCKSSGFAGSNGKFALSGSAYQMKVKLDATISGTDGNGYYTISLAYNNDATPITGEAIAEDMETKIRAIADNIETADVGFSLSYKNASVEFTDSKFKIISGSISKYFTGNDKSSVAVAAAASNDCTAILGFDIPLTTEDLAGLAMTETQIGANYTAGNTTLTVSAGLGVEAGDACLIYDAANSDYFVAASGTTDTSIAVSADPYLGISNNYTTASGAIVQVLKQQDPDGEPNSYYTTIDSIARWGVKSIINQIDYSS